MIKVSFTAYLPSFSQSNESQNANIDTTTIFLVGKANGTECLAFSSESIEVKLKKICVYDLRSIIYSGYDFYLHEITPNPAGTNGAEAEFSIGYKALTEIKIFNNASELVSKPLSKELSAGSYKISLPTENLSSGIYFIEFSCGQFKATRKFAVVK